MTWLVIDASVVLAWFASPPEEGAAASLRFREQVRTGAVVAVVPPLLFIEVVNVAARRWKWPAAAVRDLAETLLVLPWQVASPPLAEVARWTEAGLSAYDATYVALAESGSCGLITTDAQVLAAAPGVAAAP